MARGDVELVKVAKGGDEVGQWPKAKQAVDVQIESERVQRKRQTPAQTFDIRFLQRPDREKRGGAIGLRKRLDMLGLLRREKTLRQADVVDAAFALLDVDADVALPAHRERNRAARVGEVKAERMLGHHWFAEFVGAITYVRAGAPQVASQDAAHQAARPQE